MYGRPCFPQTDGPFFFSSASIYLAHSHPALVLVLALVLGLAVVLILALGLAPPGLVLVLAHVLGHSVLALGLALAFGRRTLVLTLGVKTS